MSACTKEAILQATNFKVGSFPFKYLGVPFSPQRLLASQFSPLLHKLESTIQCWMGKHLSYVGCLELLMSVLHGMVLFWLAIFPLPATIINHISCICRNFLWSGNISGNKSVMVASKTVCLPKHEGGLGLVDIKARNISYLAELLWNNHLKTDSLWIQWVHHFYLRNQSVWNAGFKKSSSPLWKSILFLKDQLVQECGGHSQVISLMQNWQNKANSYTANAFEHLRPKGTPVSWS